VRVFVSSTLGELAEERRAVARAISALRLTPVMFELGARPYPPREVYQQYLAQSDVFIGLYWQRYGQPAPGAHVSGLEEEFELSGGLPRLLYVKAPAPDREPGLADLLARIKGESLASYRYFRTPAELAGWSAMTWRCC
jgi:sugar/nucleoside kinase (ribokinase family)